MKKSFGRIAILLIAVFCLSLCACGGGGEEKEVTITNSLGFELDIMNITASDDDSWGDNLIDNGLDQGESISLMLSERFGSESVAADILAYDMDGDMYEFYGLELSSGMSVELVWEDADPEAVLTDAKGNTERCTGAFYMTSDIGEPEPDELTEPDDESEEPSVETGLLPSPSDPLVLTAAIDGYYPEVSIQYPETLSVHEHPNVSKSLSFNAVNEEGTDDYYSNILFYLMPISGFDDVMTQGYDSAKYYMQKMLSDCLDSMYGDKVLKSIGSDFEDGGWYYGITGYVWLDGSVFNDGPSMPVRSVFILRYAGPGGYALVANIISLENRIQNYYDLACNMLDTATFGGDWSTAPKTASGDAAGGHWSDTGDYGDTYYWYDEDGDVWYWNGYEDVFIGYGDDYYIDGDQYYESNDWGWDYDDDYYDYYDDYDPWSDPGDYGW